MAVHLVLSKKKYKNKFLYEQVWFAHLSKEEEEWDIELGLKAIIKS